MRVDNANALQYFCKLFKMNSLQKINLLHIDRRPH